MFLKILNLYSALIFGWALLTISASAYCQDIPLYSSDPFLQTITKSSRKHKRELSRIKRDKTVLSLNAGIKVPDGTFLQLAYSPRPFFEVAIGGNYNYYSYGANANVKLKIPNVRWVSLELGVSTMKIAGPGKKEVASLLNDEVVTQLSDYNFPEFAAKDIDITLRGAYIGINFHIKNFTIGAGLTRYDYTKLLEDGFDMATEKLDNWAITDPESGMEIEGVNDIVRQLRDQIPEQLHDHINKKIVGVPYITLSLKIPLVRKK